jgi:hypothetical protein
LKRRLSPTLVIAKRGNPVFWFPFWLKDLNSDENEDEGTQKGDQQPERIKPLVHERHPLR